MKVINITKKLSQTHYCCTHQHTAHNHGKTWRCKQHLLKVWNKIENYQDSGRVSSHNQGH